MCELRAPRLDVGCECMSQKDIGPSLSVTPSFMPPNLLWVPEPRQTQPLQITLCSVGDRHKYNKSSVRRGKAPFLEEKLRLELFECGEVEGQGPEGEGKA